MNYALETKMITILLLGETGVGKTTLINGFANYLTYESLDDAEQGGLIDVTSSMFTEMNSLCEEGRMPYDVNNDTESTIPIPGKSITQMPKTYLINLQSIKIRIIDTPGIGDVRGIEKDRKNMEIILAHLSQYEEVNGIIILMRRHSSNMSAKFLFCIKELLSHLHMDAHKNILFCFSNTGNTSKETSNTMLALKDLLTKSASTGIRMTRATVYCIDSDYIRYLKAMESFEYEVDRRKEYAANWKKGVRESVRLVCHISFLAPHSIQKTITINNLRHFITEQNSPLAPIINIIQTCIAAIEDKQAEMTDTNSSTEELQMRLRLPTFQLKTINYEHPKTVCTWHKFAMLIPPCPDEMKQTYGKTICHDHCNDVTPGKNVIQWKELQKFVPMDQNGKCQECLCNCANHTCVTNDTVLEITWVLDEGLRKLIEEKVLPGEVIKEHQKKLDDTLNQLNYEKNRLAEVNTCFHCFLEHNSIYTYNDVLPDYFDYLIEDRRMKAESISSNSLYGLTDLRKMYLEEIEVIKEARIRRRDSFDNMDEMKIKELMTELEELPNIGMMMKYVNGRVREKDETEKTLSDSEIHLPRGSEIALQLKEKIKNSRAITDLGLNEKSRTINILLLGETGVGKSTWINGFVNYLTYDSLEEAERGEPVCLIPTRLTEIDSDSKEHSSINGIESDRNESTELDDHSSTKLPRSYLFDLQNLKIRIIDTPGVGDATDFDKDRDNMQRIMDHLSQYGHIKGIVILMKPHNFNLYVFKEILTRLHKDASRNIVICFTHGRSIFYRPDETMSLFKDLLESNQHIDVKLTKDSIFCVDNECIRFLMAKKFIEYNYSEREQYTVSWKKAVDESRRMVCRILSLKPHLIQKTLSVNEVRHSMKYLSRQLASSAIKANQSSIRRVIPKISPQIVQIQNEIAELKKQLEVLNIQMKAITLDHRKTEGLTPNSLSSTVNIDGRQQTHNMMICHEYYQDVVADKHVMQCDELKMCSKLDQSTDECQMSLCPMENHIFIPCDNSLETMMMEDEEIRRLIKEKEKAIREHQKKMVMLEELNQVTYERKRLQEIIATFVCFLKHNSIIPFNNSLMDYLDLLIEDERRKLENDNNSRTYDELKRECHKEFESIKKVMERETSVVYSIEENRIKELMSELKELSIIGPKIQRILKETMKKKNKTVKLNECVICLPQKLKMFFNLKVENVTSQ